MTDIQKETVLQIVFCQQLLVSFLSDVPSSYFWFLLVDPDC